ncbi:MAG: TldD/PmbA family protein [Chloroflexi bacterium]|nr:TldD/PmbA family protein [Chloroflexota bacterium]
MVDLFQQAADSGFDQAEVYRVSSESQPIGFESNRLKEASRRDTSGAALRVIKDGRIGLSATTDPASEAGLVERVGEIAPFGAAAAFEMPGPADYPAVDIFDPAVEALEFDTMVQTGQSLIDAIRKDWPELNCSASVSRGLHTTSLRNTAGLEADFRQTSYSVGFGGELVRGEDMLFVWEGYASSRLFTDTGWMVESVLRQLEWARNTAEAPSGQVPVIFTPRGVSAALLGPLVSGFNGKSVMTGSSPMGERLGEKVVDERISVFDDATIAGAIGSRPYDDEGIPSRRFPLIDRGVASNFLYDLQTAGRMKAASTGAAGRGLTSLPGPGTSVVDIAPGDTPYDDLFLGIKEGIVVERLLGAGQGNQMGGDFKANVLLGYKIENGKIVGRIKDTMISGNVYDALSKLEAVSDTAEWVYGTVRAPAIRCLGVEVAAAG